jgi:hypothetical protein
VAQRSRAHCHQIVVVPSSLSPSHCRHLIVVVVVVINVIVVVVVVAAAIAVHITFVVVAILAAILVFGIAAVAVTVVALSSSCLLYSLAVNPRNSTKASQGGITHDMLMERLPLGWP